MYYTHKVYLASRISLFALAISIVGLMSVGILIFPQDVVAVNYSRDAAYHYAWTHWNILDCDSGYNYDSIGGDCCHFVSHCLGAGGVDVYNQGGGGHDGIIILCDQLYNWLLDGRAQRVSSWTQLEKGDVILYDWGGGPRKWDHTSLYIGNGQIASHNEYLWGAPADQEAADTAYFHILNGGDLSVSLTANPSTGTAPLAVTLTADVSGTASGTINYTFWWDCNDPGTSVDEVMAICGSIPTPDLGTCTENENGMKCNAVTDDPKTVNHIYSSAGTYTAKVIVERGSADPAEARVSITPTIAGDLNGDCVVDIFDLVIVGSSFGLSPGDPGYNPRADANHSGGAIDIFDLVMVGSHFGDTCGLTLSFSSEWVAAQPTTVRVSPETQTIDVGDEAVVDIQIVEVSDLYGFQLDLTYDSSILEYVSWSPGPFLGGSIFWIPPDTSTPGVIKSIAAARTTPGVTVSGTGTLITVTFRAIAGGSSTISIENLKLADDEAHEISSTAQDGGVEVGEYFIYLPFIMKNLAF
jgi:hypothetical protein